MANREASWTVLKGYMPQMYGITYANAGFIAGPEYMFFQLAKLQCGLHIPSGKEWCQDVHLGSTVSCIDAFKDLVLESILELDNLYRSGASQIEILRAKTTANKARLASVSRIHDALVVAMLKETRVAGAFSADAERAGQNVSILKVMIEAISSLKQDLEQELVLLEGFLRMAILEAEESSMGSEADPQSAGSSNSMATTSPKPSNIVAVQSFQTSAISKGWRGSFTPYQIQRSDTGVATRTRAISKASLSSPPASA